MTDRPTFRTLAGAANHVADVLATASTEQGLSPLECAEMAHMLDKAMVIGAPIAPIVAVPIGAEKEWQA